MNEETKCFLENQYSVSIDFNPHKIYYDKIEDYIDINIDAEDKEKYKDTIKRCIESNNIWCLRYYPFTAIGFNEIFSDTFEGLMEELKKEMD